MSSSRQSARKSSVLTKSKQACVHSCSQTLKYVSGTEIAQLTLLKQTEAKELTRGIVFYKRLGLDFRRVGGQSYGFSFVWHLKFCSHYDARSDDRLRLIFTQIDASAPEREFCFTIKVDQSDKYQGKVQHYRSYKKD